MEIKDQYPLKKEIDIDQSAESLKAYHAEKLRIYYHHYMEEH